MFRTALCHSHPPLCGDQPELGDCVGDAKATKALIYAAGDLNCFVYFVLRVIFVLTICIMAAYKRCVIVLKLRHICSFHVSKTAALPLSTLCAPREGKGFVRILADRLSRPQTRSLELGAFLSPRTCVTPRCRTKPKRPQVLPRRPARIDEQKPALARMGLSAARCFQTRPSCLSLSSRTRRDVTKARLSVVGTTKLVPRSERRATKA